MASETDGDPGTVDLTSAEEATVAMDVDKQPALPSQPTAALGVPFEVPHSKVDTTDQEKRLKNAILKAVINGHITAVERALQTLEEDCVLPAVQAGKQLLDFLPENALRVMKHVPEDFKFHSPLMIACEKKQKDLVKLLLDKGASVAFQNKDKLNAFHIACTKGDMEIVDLLLGAVERQRNFTRNKDHTSDLIKAVNTRNKRGWTPLMYAVGCGHVEIVDRLVQTGQVDYAIKNKKQYNILHIASRGSSTECLEKVFALYEGNSEMIFAQDKHGFNILHHACASKEIEVLKWLLKHLNEEDHAKLINQKSKVGYTPYLIACEYQHNAALEVLHEHKADISVCAKDRDEDLKVIEDGDKSALHLAAIHDNKEIAQLLIKHGCSTDRQDSEGNSPLHVAYRKSSLEVITVLRRANGRLEQLKNKDGELAFEVIPEDVIPPEIKKRGPEAIELYKEALRKGKEKIPRCNLLILGEERVGKTSVYRLLVDLGFDPDLKPTKGIDNNIVDTVDIRHISIEQWEQKTEDEQQKQSDELFADGIACEIQPHLTKKDSKKVEAVQELQLLDEIERIKKEIKKKKEDAAERERQMISSQFQALTLRSNPPVAQPQRAPIQPKLPSEPKPTHSPLATPQEVVPQPPKAPTETKPQVQVEPKVVIPPPVVRQPVPRIAQDSDQLASKEADEEPDISDLPPIPKENPPSVPRLGRRHSRTINKRLKSGTKLKKKNPSLMLCSFDFAGQPEYRPMHHCFITRRAIYIVVFNLQHMVAYLKSRNVSHNPLEEIRYWIHSIHAHIYPPDEDERMNDSQMRRVCLVGTHRAPKNPKPGEKTVSKEELDEIDTLLREEILSDSRCVDHLHSMKHNNRIFVAVENSLDGKDQKKDVSEKKKERKESGVNDLQQELKSISENLQFLEEVYPVLWLQFESELVNQRKERSNSVIKLEELRIVAARHGITDRSAQDLAFTFFHDTGKIICLKQTPTLFLGEEEKRQLDDLVVLNPSWLISVMKVIFDMDERYEGVPKSHVVNLVTKGLASTTLLRKSWSKFLDPENPQSFYLLCLMLQANCLIYPVDDMPPSQEQDASESKNQSLTPPARSKTESSNKEQLYLVPNRLPLPKQDDKPVVPCYTFYFDFQRFLPNEIYHRFVCLMQATSKDTRKSFFSSTFCKFYKVHGCIWKIELQQSLHRLKVSVISCDEKAPSQFITKIHSEYLKRICEGSNLEGLEYYGGPLVKCELCAGEKRLIRFVGYKEGTEQDSEEVCPECLKEFDVDSVLKLQKEEMCKKLNTVDLGGKICSRVTTDESSVHQKIKEEESVSAMPPLDQSLSGTKQQGGVSCPLETGDAFMILMPLAAQWQNIGTLLKIKDSVLDRIKEDNHHVSNNCLREMISTWLKQTEPVPCWEALREAVKVLDPSIAQKIEEHANSLEK